MEDTELGSLHGAEGTSPRFAEPRNLARGEVVGRYVIVDKLGAGGMGVVYSAYDPELDRRVALKLLNPRGGVSRASRGRARLIREAQALAQLNHTNVVTVHDVGEHEGRVFLAMEYVDGITLAAWIAQGPHPWHEVIEVLTAAAHGLVAAHAKDMTHRDFKPDNVMLTGPPEDRRVVVMDFGLATAPSAQEESAEFEASTSSSLAASVDLDSLTRTGTMMGTPAYMAPEQHTGTADQHADQFSFCVTLYEALYGSRPFVGSSAPELLAAAVYGDLQPAPPGDAVPKWVREAVVRGLEADPAARWPTITALVDALHDNPSRRRWLAAGLGGVVLTVASVYGITLFQDQRLHAACADESSALDEVWGAEQRQTLADAFDRSSLSYAAATWSRTEARLDEEAQAWASLRLSTCMSRTQLEPRLRAVQDSCFETRRRRVETLVGVLSDPSPGVIQRATELVEVDSQVCAEGEWLRRAPPVSTDPARRVRQEQLRQDFDLGRALRRAGEFADATELQEALIESALEAEERHIAASARFELGAGLLQLDEFDKGAKTLEDAYFESKDLSFDTLATRAARSLVAAHGNRLADAKTGRLWARHAQVLVDPLEQPVEQARLDIQKARLEFAAGNYQDALSLAEQALSVFESELGPYGTTTLDAKQALFSIYDRLGRIDDAVRLAREVLQAREEGLGPLHPTTRGAHSNLAAALISANKLEEAEEHARLSFATGGEQTLGTALGMENLALVLRQQGGPLDEAIELSQNVLEIRRAHLPKTHIQIGHTLLNRSVLLFSANKLDAIPPLLDEAIEIYRAHGGPKSPFLVSTYRLQGGVAGTAGRFKEALDSFEAAADAQARILGPKHPDTITVRVEHAQTALEQGDYIRTIELAAPWVEETKDRDDVPTGTIIALHTVYGRANLLAGSPELAETSLNLALKLAPSNNFHASWAPVIEIDLGRLRWKTTPDKEEAIADVEAALKKLKARDDADPAEVKRAETWLRQVKPGL
ncbi:MAG: protein kinase domain-containing protein [Nannocystales bacterium]